MKVLTQPLLWHQEQLLQYVTCFLERKNPDLSCEILMLTNSTMPFFCCGCLSNGQFVETFRIASHVTTLSRQLIILPHR